MIKNFTEAKFQTIFGKWMKKNGFTGAFELKVSKGSTVPFSEFQPQQLPSLSTVRNGVFRMKLTDASLGLKPFDSFCLSNEPAYVAIMFNVNTDIGQSKFYLIDINAVNALIEEGSKSIKKKDCELYGVTVDIK